MADPRKITAERMKARMKDLRLTQDSLAEKIGATQAAISQILNCKTNRTTLLPQISDHLGVDLAWLTGASDDAGIVDINSGLISLPDDTVTIPELDIGYSMGGGAVMVEPEHGAWHGFGDARPAAGGDPDNDDDSITLDAPHNAQMRTFPRAWLEPLIKGRVDQVFIARGEGDSMQPTLLDGDVVLIDRAQNSVTQQDRLWAIGYGELVMIKRVRRLPDGGYQINSDNPAVTAITAYDDEMHIVGRVVWIGRKM